MADLFYQGFSTSDKVMAIGNDYTNHLLTHLIRDIRKTNAKLTPPQEAAAEEQRKA